MAVMKNKSVKMKCKVCGNATNVIFNINFKKVYICEGCANMITLQQIISIIPKIEKKNEISL